MNLFTNIFTYKNIGTRELQEDDFYFFDFEDMEKNKFHSFFIFDGHGAKTKEEALPEFMIQQNVLINELKKYFATRKVTTVNLISFFPYFDSYLENKIKKRVGTCLSAVLISSSSIFTITLGDTSIKIFDSNNKLYFQTQLHNFKNKTEVERYKKNKQDSLIKDERYKGLLISRTIGDYDCKTLGERCLIPIPEIKKIYNNRPLIFLLKTDGMTIPSKTLIAKYNNNTIESFLEKRKFANNVCLVIFSTVCESKNVVKHNNEENKKNKILLSFLEYVYE